MHYNPPVVGSNRVRVAAILVWVAVVVVRVTNAAQDPQTKTDSPKSTMDGVYSAAQAERGLKLYGMSCLGGCHNAASHKGSEFKRNWAGHTVGELYERVADTMPDDNPGTLTAKESADVLGYLFKLNGMPAGKEDLGTDRDALAKIKIVLPPPSGGVTTVVR